MLLALLTGFGLWRYAANRQAGSLPPAQASASAAQPSIAVLPFLDMSATHDQEYFSEGLSEELLNRLAKIPQLKVAGLTSSFSFKGSGKDLKQIGRELGVAHVLEGTVRKVGERVRVDVKLVKVSDGYAQWAKDFDRKLTDVFALQDEIAAKIVQELQVKLLPEQRVTSRNTHVPTPEAFDEYLRGQRSMLINSREAFQQALAHFERAVALDPQYVDAWALLALSQSFAVERPGPGIDQQAGWRRAHEAVEKALALDPDSAEAYATRGFLRFTDDWDWAGAQADFDQAFEVAPPTSRNLLRYALVQAALGSVSDGIASLRRAIELDPMFSPPWNQLGILLTFTGEFDEARTAIARAQALEPANTLPATLLANVDLLQGRSQDALAAFEKNPNEVYRLIGTAWARFDLGQKPEADRLLDELTTKFAPIASYNLARLHAHRGERDAAFDWLDRACAAHDSGVLRVRYDPALAPLRDDPRYRALLEKMKLPQ